MRTSTCIGATLQQGLYSATVACCRCLKQWCLAFAVLSIHACTSADEQLYCFNPTTVGCQMQRCGAILETRCSLSPFTKLGDACRGHAACSTIAKACTLR